ncbi:MAG: hypothetical protein R3F17_15360 [Planctomycetota bacterium]
MLGLDAEERAALEIEARYAGYIARQELTVARLAEQENTSLPADLDYLAMKGLTGGAGETRPPAPATSVPLRASRGAAPDVALLAVCAKRHRGEWAARAGLEGRGSPPFERFEAAPRSPRCRSWKCHVWPAVIDGLPGRGRLAGGQTPCP